LDNGRTSIEFHEMNSGFDIRIAIVKKRMDQRVRFGTAFLKSMA